MGMKNLNKINVYGGGFSKSNLSSIYVKPSLKILNFQFEDIIQTSGGCAGDGENSLKLSPKRKTIEGTEDELVGGVDDVY